jgi:hypothetical protein
MKLLKYTFLCLGLFLLFFGKSNGEFTRSGTALWDLGHVIIWALGTHLMLVDFNLFAKSSVRMRYILIAGLGILIGILTEVIQVFSGRAADIQDLFKDIIGILFGLAFFNPIKNKIPVVLLTFFQLAVLLLLIYHLIPFSKAVVDETIARFQFPVLSSFETPFEPDRWITKGREKISRDFVYRGEKALKVEIRPEKYAGFSLDFFPSDWSGYRFLEMHLYNPVADSLTLYLRIDDKDHKLSGLAYTDRYNSSRLVHPGWNHIQIALEDIKTAPQSREMDLHHIKRLILFFIQPADWLILYIDEVTLIK